MLCPGVGEIQRRCRSAFDSNWAIHRFADYTCTSGHARFLDIDEIEVLLRTLSLRAALLHFFDLLGNLREARVDLLQGHSTVKQHQQEGQERANANEGHR